MIAVSQHPLVRIYVAQLDHALTALPEREAAELREQISAHLRDALDSAADDAAVRAVLDSLGPPSELVAEAAGLFSAPGHCAQMAARASTSRS